ncbi:MAG: NUDIX hydrolase [Thermoproteus sp. AZ2]|jgi:8-oxo-dGTP pyrophosphatase MutT (NUDIX family)|uniref:NUDIX hydrolase n=1 Tax=Thermoproteus sp. AZ2 TaxID=1609232 RepID=A0ACC6UZ94_9CREN|nr:MAG: DNA mismatch repair protein MutT [Thermoproteus sp. AZ2]
MCLQKEVPPGGPNTAAVAAILRGGKLLVIKRAERPGDPWSGQIGFPGGHWEPGDADLRKTVIREAREEVGVDLEEAELLGALGPDSPMNAPTLKVYSFVFRADAMGEEVRPGEEVAAARWISRLDLAEAAFRGRPAFSAGGWIIWGLTYRFIKRLIDCGLF